MLLSNVVLNMHEDMSVGFKENHGVLQAPTYVCTPFMQTYNYTRLSMKVKENIMKNKSILKHRQPVFYFRQ